MRVSIITVTYNSEATLRDAVESVLHQDYSDLELIVVDGASTDSTLEILKEYSTSQLRYVSEKDSGIYDAINKGIRMATGDIIGILNSDDFLADENVIQRIASDFSTFEVDALYADVIFVNRYDTSKTMRLYSSKNFKPWMFKFGFQPAHPTFYAKKELFDKLGAYRIDLKIAGDFELLLRFLKKNTIKYKYVNDIWVKMRVGGVSTSGISSVIKLNDEIVKAHQYNNLYTNKVLVYSKYLFKWWGFIFKK